jgi:eukaryotic-like serine/threonine-protein kinase
MNFGSQHQPSSSRYIGEQQRYCLEQSLGQGGMGKVYVATDTLLGRQVAIKILKETLINTEAIRKRFEREVSLCAALHSENIVQVTDYGVTPEGHPFFVMEYLVGKTLAQLMQQERQIAPNRTVQIIIQVCHGLSLAHEGVVLHRHHGRPTERIQVIHRDLKPENLFLVPTTLGELVKILDFGIAKLKTQEEGFTDLNTSSFIGTYHYASPEQLELSVALDTRSDIYSLGMILYEMLSGTDPFGLQAQQNQRGAGMSWVKAHLTQPPTPLRSQPRCQEIPCDLEAAVMKCLAKKPNDRWDSVNSLSFALKSAIGIPSIMSKSYVKDLGNLETTLASLDGEFDRPSVQFRPDPVQTSLPNDQAAALEKLLAQEIGPIASVILPQVLAESHTWLDTINRLLGRIPEKHRLHFHERAIALERRLTTSGDQSQKLSHPSSQNSHPRTPSYSSLSASNGEQNGQLPAKITPEQLQKLEQRLTHHVGPIAKLILNQLLSQEPEPNYPDLVQRLAEKIPDRKAANEFLRSLL